MLEGPYGRIRKDIFLTDISEKHILFNMIKSYGDIETEKIHQQIKSKKLPPEIQKRALVKLMLIDAADTEEDLRIPPGNRFEHLSGNLKEYCSIRINDQWRIVFKYINFDAYEVSIQDYH